MVSTIFLSLIIVFHGVSTFQQHTVDECCLRQDVPNVCCMEGKNKRNMTAIRKQYWTFSDMEKDWADYRFRCCEQQYSTGMSTGMNYCCDDDYLREEVRAAQTTKSAITVSISLFLMLGCLLGQSLVNVI